MTNSIITPGATYTVA